MVELGALSNGGFIWNGYGADGLRARSGVDGSPTSGPVFYSYDPQGNLAHRFDPHGMDAASDLAAFDAYGALLGEYNVSGGAVESHRDPVGFGGQWGGYTDPETGLVLMTHRYYDAGKGRFLTRDPIGDDGGLNLYGYAGNNPVTGSDPSGESTYVITWGEGVSFGSHAAIAVDWPGKHYPRVFEFASKVRHPGLSGQLFWASGQSEAGQVLFGSFSSQDLVTPYHQATELPDSVIRLPTTSAQDAAIRSWLTQAQASNYGGKPFRIFPASHDCTTFVWDAPLAGGVRRKEDDLSFLFESNSGVMEGVLLGVYPARALERNSIPTPNALKLWALFHGTQIVGKGW